MVLVNQIINMVLHLCNFPEVPCHMEMSGNNRLSINLLKSKDDLNGLVLVTGKDPDCPGLRVPKTEPDTRKRERLVRLHLSQD